MMVLQYAKRVHQALLESDNRLLVWIGKMSRRYKQFLFGLVVGIVLAFVVAEGLSFGLRWWRSRGWEQRMESYLEPPRFPQKVAVNYDWTVQSLDGQELKMAELKGNVIVLNYWATWCPPCRAEMPSLQRLYDTMKADGIEFVFVSEEDPDAVRKFIQEKGYTFPVYTMASERPEDFKGRGIPDTFILSKDGKIAFRHIGSAKWDDQTSIDFIKSLL